MQPEKRPQTAPAFVESEEIALPTLAQELLFATATGNWNCCDVWIHSAAPAWASDVTVKLYGRTGKARALLKSVRTSEAESTTGGDGTSALVLSMRGHPCSEFEVTCTSESSSAIAAGVVYLQCWNGDAAPSSTDDSIDDGSSGTVSSSTAAHILGFLPGTGWLRARVDDQGRIAVVGAGVAGTPAGGVVTVQGASGASAIGVSGTVTANIGTAGSLALDATLTARLPAALTTAGGVKVGLVDALPAGSATIGKTDQGAGGASAWKVDGSAVTQPISASSLPLPTGAALDATLSGGTQRTKITDGTSNVAVATTTPGASDVGLVTRNIPSGTQPVSGTVDVSDRAGRLAGVVTVNNGGVISAANSSTTPLAGSGTFTGTGEDGLAYEAITVSVEATATGGAAAAGTLRVEHSTDNTNWDIRDEFAVDGGTAPTGSFNIKIGLVARYFRIAYFNGASAQIAFRLQTIKWPVKAPLPTTTKAIQSQYYVGVQQPKDAGRKRVVISFEATAPATADTLLSLVKKTDGVGATGSTTIAVTSGKRLRITCVTFSLRANAAAAAFGTLTLRENPSGATVLSSTPWLRVDVGNTENIAGAARSVIVPMPDGIEFSGANQIGASLAAQATTNIISIELIGFEY